MLRIPVKRFSDDGKQTLGEMKVNNGVDPAFILKTIELAWKDNKQQISCIPIGVYRCTKIGPSAKIPYDHFAIMDVPNRSGVCIHRANYSRQLRGCIAVGLEHVDIDGDKLKDTSNSEKALDKLLKALPAAFEIEIS